MQITLSLFSALVVSSSAFVAPRAAGPSSSTTTTTALEVSPFPPNMGSYVGMRSLVTEPYNQAIRIEGGTLRTWKVDKDSEKMHVAMKTDGRPSFSEINLWHGPNYTPCSMKIYLQDGAVYPLNVVMQPKGYGLDTVQVLNTATMEMPLTTAVGLSGPAENLGGIYQAPDNLVANGTPILVQGDGAVKAFPLDGDTKQVQVAVYATEARNVKFRIELLQGPNNVKQSIEFYASNASKTPFYALFDTPGEGYQIRFVNQYVVEFPMTVYLEALS